MIKINDILHFSEDQIEKAKVKFNKYNGSDDPIVLFKTNPDIINKQWLYWREKNRYFEVGQIAICLVKLRNNMWLLTTIDTVDSELGVVGGINYKGTPLQEYKGLFGRTIIKFHKNFQTQGVNLSTIIEEMEVLQILPDTFDDDDFPGYDNVRITYPQLVKILDRGKKDWIAALESQKAVYLITDKKTGKLYVGSATGKDGMLLQRWRAYASNGHGGNKELKKLVSEEGLGYVKEYFQYSILENYNAKVSDEIILSRESWWKEVLNTRTSGYNGN